MSMMKQAVPEENVKLPVIFLINDDGSHMYLPSVDHMKEEYVN